MSDFIKRLRHMAKCVHIAIAEKTVADDLSAGLRLAATYIAKRDARIEELEEALQTLAWQHGWGPIGKCVCIAHSKVEELGLRFDVPAKK